jgi:hypothetical protein
MTPDQKARTARILGYICVVAGALNLVLAGTLALLGETQVGFALLASGVGALTVGVIILTRRKQEPESGG